jgi:spore coat polysaccharide biosynthesis protein SpsF
MKVVAIIQARMGSTRLPGKVVRDIGGRSMLARVVRRTQRTTQLHEVVVATTGETADDIIVAECRKLSVPCFRGEEQDVLDRYYQAAHAFQADAVVRITSDCPLIDPEVVDKVVLAFLSVQPDYASNTLVRTYPRGLDTEAMTLHALECAWQRASETYQRVHVTPYLYQHPDQFKLVSVTNDQDLSAFRWTVDTVEDLEFVRNVYGKLGDDGAFSWTSVLALLARGPQLTEVNRTIAQKALHEG